MRRSRALLAPAALMLLLACGGGSSDGPAKTTAPSSLTVSQSTLLAVTFTQEMANQIPAGVNPEPIARGRSPFSSLQGMLPEGAKAHFPKADLPCLPDMTTTTDADGYTVETSDYSACTDGASGKIINRWKDTSTSHDWQLTFENLRLPYVEGGTTTLFTANGSLSYSGTRGTNGDWSLRYATGPGGLTYKAVSGSQTLFDSTSTKDVTCLWHVTSPDPVKATFTTSGHSAWSGAFFDPRSQQPYQDTYSFAITPSTPLVWTVDASQPNPCDYPVSGTIDVSRGTERLAITFTGDCGSVIINPGNLKQQLPL